jgi:hypothetical protein
MPDTEVGKYVQGAIQDLIEQGSLIRDEDGVLHATSCGRIHAARLFVWYVQGKISVRCLRSRRLEVFALDGAVMADVCKLYWSGCNVSPCTWARIRWYLCSVGRFPGAAIRKPYPELPAKTPDWVKELIKDAYVDADFLLLGVNRLSSEVKL